MKIKRYFAADMRQAIRMVRDEQGPDAVILSNRRVDGGVEIVAAVDYDERVVDQMARRRSTPPPETEPGLDAALPAGEQALGVSQQGDTEAPHGGQVVWSQEPALVAMREELKTLRGIVESQLSGLAWGETRHRHPLRAKLLERLVQLGLGPSLCTEIADRVRYGNDPEHNWRQGLGLLAHRLAVTDDDILTRGGVVALVGPTGVGKTTTVAKLAARYTLRHGANRVALVTTDCYRIGAHQQLRTYGRILNAPVYVAGDGEELGRILGSLRDMSLVMVDTAGMSQRDIRLTEQFAMLRHGAATLKTYAVFSATTQRAALDEAVRAFANVELAGCILTKLDESTCLGEALSVVIQQGLPVAYISDGQQVPEDLHPARTNNLVSRGVALMQNNRETLDDESLAVAFAGMVSNAHG